MTPLSPSQLFPDQIYHEYLESKEENRGTQTYGVRIEHIGGDRIAISVERPDGYVDCPHVFQSRENRLSITYGFPEALPETIKERVRDSCEFYSDGSIVLKLLKELKDKYVLVAEKGSPTTVAKTPLNVLKYGIMEGKPIHAKSCDGFSVDEADGRGEDDDESLIITSPDGLGVPLLTGKFELALSLLNGKPIAEIWKRNQELILKNFKADEPVLK